jgi:N-acetyl-gamma-glutamyl-phosphate reductase
MKPKIFIDGEHGTTGLQIRTLLAGRGDLDIISVPTERRKEKEARAEYLNAADIAILCLPDDAARESVSLIANDTTRVIDASTAHRVAEGWDYGFAELDKDQPARIAAAKRVANPGCWPQGPIATLRPLVEAELLPADFPVTINGITGYSGGGRTMIEDYEAKGESACEFFPYGLSLQHKHIPEIRTYGRLSRDPILQPAIGNFAQGMITAATGNAGLHSEWCRAARSHCRPLRGHSGLRGGSRALRAGRARSGHRSGALQRHQQDEGLCLRQ